MKIVLLGPPGAGKGSQAELIEKEQGICHISTGDIFREKKKENSALGKKIKGLIDAGNYVPDDITIQAIKERIKQVDCKNGYLLDGFPRTIRQAEAFDMIEKVDCVFYITSSIEKIMDRMDKRRSCPRCKRIYNLVSHPPKNDELCDNCNEKLARRPDDNPEIVKKRLQVYEEHTHPLVEYYQKKGLLVEIDGNGSLQEVYALVEQSLKNCSKNEVA